MNLIPCTSISFIFCISFLALQKFSTEGKKINSVGFFTEAQKPDICIKQLKGKVYFSPTTTEVKNQTLQKSEYQQATLLPFF